MKLIPTALLLIITSAAVCTAEAHPTYVTAARYFILANFQEQSGWVFPTETIDRAIYTPDRPGPAYVICNASLDALYTTAIQASDSIPGTPFRYNHSVGSWGTQGTWSMHPSKFVIGNMAGVTENSQYSFYCAYRPSHRTLAAMVITEMVEIVRIHVQLENTFPKPQPTLQLPGALHLGDINPGQSTETPVPVAINCATCADGQPMQGTIAWRLESSPDNPSAEKPGMIFMGAESAATEGTNVVTFGRFLTEVSDYELRWPRTNSAPLAPGSYRWTLTMTLSIL